MLHEHEVTDMQRVHYTVSVITVYIYGKLIIWINRTDTRGENQLLLANVVNSCSSH